MLAKKLGIYRKDYRDKYTGGKSSPKASSPELSSPEPSSPEPSSPQPSSPQLPNLQTPQPQPLPSASSVWKRHLAVCVCCDPAGVRCGPAGVRCDSAGVRYDPAGAHCDPACRVRCGLACARSCLAALSSPTALQLRGDPSWEEEEEVT